MTGDRAGTGDRERGGMTIVELLVVTVLGALVLGAIYQVLITSQRTYATQSVEVQGQQTLRAGMDILSAELREVSPTDGDLLTFETDWMEIRGSRAVGTVCAILTGGSNPTIQARKVGRFLRGDSARVFFDNDPDQRSDDQWRAALVEVVDTTGTLSCPNGGTAQEVILHDVTFGSPPDSITIGSPVRNVVRYGYGLGTYDGRPYLVREEADGNTNPLVGPLRAEVGVEFRYLDGTGTATATAGDVRQIEITLRTASDFRSGGEPYRDSLTSRIHTRN